MRRAGGWIGALLLFAVTGLAGRGVHVANAAASLPVPASSRAEADTLEAYPRAGAEAWLGVRVQELDPASREAFDHEGGGIIVAAVNPASPAARAGLRSGDVITQADGTEVRTKDDLAGRVHGHQPGDILVLRVRRSGREETVEVRLEGGPPGRDQAGRDPAGPGGWPWRATSYLGARVEALAPDLAAYFDVAAGSGVLVVAVFEGEPAARAGIKAGDVLTRIDGVPVKSPADLGAVLRGRAPHARVVATIVRHRREEEIAVVLGEMSPLDQLLEQVRVDRDDIDSLLDDLRARMSGGQEHMSSRMKQLEELIGRMEEKMDALVDQAGK